MGGKWTFAGAASHLQYFGIAVIRSGWCAYTKQMVEQGGEPPYAAAETSGRFGAA